jgi:type I restriction-modification system DNA methylase subunit
MPVDERTFCASVAGWINDVLKRRTDLPYGEAKVEEHPVGDRKRLDLKIFRRDLRRVALTGEVKMPDKPYGRSHLDGELVEDAFEKASRLGSNYYFTWNVNRFALFETHQEGVAFMERVIEDREVVQIRDSDEVRKEPVQAKIRDFWEELLETLARIERGERPLLNLPLDRRFIIRLEEALEEPVSLTFDELSVRYRRVEGFREEIRAWMRDDQGWEISEDAELVRRNLERAARLSCYVLANRLVFYEVLRRRFTSLAALRSISLGTTGEGFAAAVNRRFLDAIETSRDYETIFASEDFGSRVPYLSDRAVPAWRRLVDGIEDFDFTRLDYDIIGSMYEALIGPEERYRWGQFFTKPDVVDLINAFCIRAADARVLDPACGGGTFLVRAYARKRALAEREGRHATHQRLLAELCGIDIAAFPAQLSTINLAARHLVAEANYPRVAREDFFDVTPGKVILRLPLGTPDSPNEPQGIAVGDIDAVVGNPPYRRQEELSKEYKGRLADLVGREYVGPARPKLSGRSDIYAYFFPHGGAFLKDGGYVGLVTSVGWLDTDYGFRLQEFFLNNFRIIAVMESQVEKWFEDARVTTAVTILQKEPDEEKRRSNRVRFIQLRRPLAEIYTGALNAPISEIDEVARQADMDAIRDLIENADRDDVTGYWRVRMVSQGELWDAGCRVRLEPQQAPQEDVQTYKGGKWGQHIRAPDVYIDLLDRCKDRLVPLSEAATVRFGFKTGADKFFCVRDVTEQEIERTGSPAAFHRKWAITVEDAKKVRIVRAGDGSRHPVEARFLEPEFHSLMEASRIVVTPGDAKRLVINAPISRAKLRKTRLARYVEESERKAWHEGSTVASRAKTRPWYDLGLRPKGERAPIFWPMAQQYRHLAPWNNDKMPCNHNLFDVWPEQGVEPRVLWAVLNSTIVALTKPQFGRLAGIEGNLKTEVVDVNMMLVPDPRSASKELANRLVAAATRMSRRALRRYLYEEFELPDRRELDDAVLELLGIEDSQEREALRERIYHAIETDYRAIRERELIAQKDRGRSKLKARVTAGDLAHDIWQSEKANLKLLEFPQDFTRGRRNTFRFDLPSGKVEVGHAMMETGRHPAARTIRVGGPSGTIHEVGSVPKCEFLQAASECGRYGVIEIPKDDSDCESAVREFRSYVADLRVRFQALAEQRTPGKDTKKQQAIAKILLRNALQSSHSTAQ